MCIYITLELLIEPFVSLLRDGDWEVRLFVLVRTYKQCSPLIPTDISTYIHTNLKK